MYRKELVVVFLSLSPLLILDILVIQNIYDISENVIVIMINSFHTWASTDLFTRDVHKHTFFPKNDKNIQFSFQNP
jgi:hypothetical protein